MLDKLIGGYGHEFGHGYGHEFGNGYGHKDHRSSGFGFEEHKEFVSHEESERGYFGRQPSYDHRVRLPANHGRPPMAHMPVFDEEDSDSDMEEFYKSSRGNHTTVLPHHGNNHHQQPPHTNFMPPPPMAQPHHKGKMANGWQERHEDESHGEHGMQHHGGHGMQHHGGHGMQHHGGHGMQHHGGHGMQHHGGHGMQHHGGHGMQQHGTHGMKQYGTHELKHEDRRLMAPQIPPHHVYLNPSHGSGSGRAVVMKASEKWRMSNITGGHQKVGWGSKGL